MKKIFIFFVLLAIFFTFSSPALALDNSKIQFAKAFVYWFNWLMAVAGMLAGISFAIGAIQFMISDHANGKDRMLGSLLGLALLLGSWIIMQAINPKLTTLQLSTGLGVGPGVFYVKDNNDKATVPDQEADTTPVFEAGYKKIKYDCSGEGINYLISWYDKPGFQNNSGESRASSNEFLTCNQTKNVPENKSIKIMPLHPGVYFFSDSGCRGEVSTATMESIENIQGSLTFAPKSFKIYTGTYDPNSTFSGIGVLIHENPSLEYGGLCGDNFEIVRAFRTNNNINHCKDIPSWLTPGSADVVKLPIGTTSLGSGVNFYSESTGWNKAEEAGVKKVTNQAIIPRFAQGLQLPAKNMKFTYAVSVNSDYQQKFKTFNDKQGSIQINGNYIVGLFSKSPFSSNHWWCMTFKDHVEDIDQTEAVVPSFDSTSADSEMRAVIFPAIK